MKIKFSVKQEISKKEAKSIMRICEENHSDNGGTLHFKALELPCKWTVLAKHNGQVVGYAVLYPEVLEKNDIYCRLLLIKIINTLVLESCSMIMHIAIVRDTHFSLQMSMNKILYHRHFMKK